MKEVSKEVFIESYLNINDASIGRLFPCFYNMKDLSNMLAVIVEAFDMKLREIEQFLDKFKAIVFNSTEYIDSVILSLLLIAKDMIPLLYNQIAMQKINLNNQSGDVESNVSYHKKFNSMAKISFNIPSLCESTQYHMEISLVTYLQTFLYANRNRKQLVNDGRKGQVNLTHHHINGFSESTVEVATLTYHLANHDFCSNDYNDLVELACCLR